MLLIIIIKSGNFAHCFGLHKILKTVGTATLKLNNKIEPNIIVYSAGNDVTS